MKAKKEGKLTAGDVVDALRKGPWQEPAHAWLLEVRDKTGYSYGGRDRYADALVVSCYPSRGIWAAGLEVKVDRADWKRELADPTKTAILKYCDFWWVAAPKGVVDVGELPEAWGLWEVDGAKVKVAKPAPRLTPEPYSAPFVASVLRNAATLQKEAHEAARASGKEEYADKVRDLTSKNYELESQLRRGGHEYNLKTLEKAVAAFEAGAGLKDGTIAGRAHYEDAWAGDQKRLGQAFCAALKIANEGHLVDSLEKKLRAAADLLHSVRNSGVVGVP